MPKRIQTSLWPVSFEELPIDSNVLLIDNPDQVQLNLQVNRSYSLGNSRRIAKYGLVPDSCIQTAVGADSPSL